MITLILLKNLIDKTIEDICKNNYLTPEDLAEINEALLIESLNIDINVAEVRECPNRPGDFGVFAKVDIKKNDLITLYPVHSYENSKKPHLIMDHFKNHILKISPDKIISGDPKIISNTYCGHMCNDGIKYTHVDDLEEYEKKSSLYIKLSKLKQNADIVILNDIIPCVIAIKDISKDNEILVHYGISRWNSFN